MKGIAIATVSKLLQNEVEQIGVQRRCLAAPHTTQQYTTTKTV